MKLSLPRVLLAFLLAVIITSCGGEHDGSTPAMTGTTQQAVTKSFAVGSLVIPMDTTYQNNGTLKAFGLVYKLLSNGVPVSLANLTGKASGGIDFTASGKDLQTAAVITAFGYRGGPFVIDSADRAAALPIITAWQVANVTAVHDMTAAFTADIRRTLVAAPRIAIFLDGNEIIAFTYLNAAGIPDSTGKAWPAATAATYPTYPDVLTGALIRGATVGGAADGALLRADGTPAWCQVTSMHYLDPVDDEVVREVRLWLASTSNVHAFMECKAVQAFENSVNGHFLTTNGIVDDGVNPAPLTDRIPDSPFAQHDGSFSSVFGFLDSIGLAVGSTFYAADVTLFNLSTAPTTQRIVWMTGNLDGSAAKGKVSYLAGHQYTNTLPISTNPTTNGIRLFLDSLFESNCASAATQPVITFTKSAPATTSASTITFTINYSNTGTGIADSAVITDAVPAGTTFVSATGGGTAAAGVVTWNLGNLKPGASGSVTFTVSVAADGTYTNQAKLGYKVSLTSKSINSNTTSTVRAPACTVDTDCAATKYCDTPTGACKDKLDNGTAIPSVPGHAPAVSGTCTAAAAGVVCKSGVCDTDDKCGILNGDGPCTAATGATVCRSAVCDVDGKCGLANGDGPCTVAGGPTVCRAAVCDVDLKCGYADGDGPCATGLVCRSAKCDVVSTKCLAPGACTVDSDCDTTTQFCDTAAKKCTPRLPNGTAMPTIGGHAPTLDGTCAVPAAAAVCVSKVCDTADDKCGYKDGHTCDAPAKCRSTFCAVASGICIPVGGCATDADCGATSYCDTPSATCKGKLDNGTSIPTVPGHAPPVAGKCTDAAAAVVCKSAVCDPKDDKCGLADGDGPCKSPTECRSGVCDGTVCGKADAGADAGGDAGGDASTDAGVEASADAGTDAGDDSALDTGGGIDGSIDGNADGSTRDTSAGPASDDGTLAGGGCGCTLPGNGDEGAGYAPMFGVALAMFAAKRRRGRGVARHR